MTDITLRANRFTEKSVAPAWLHPKLVCPICRAKLLDKSIEIVCTDCGATFPQQPGYVNLYSPAFLASDEKWSDRLDECSQWYAEQAQDTECVSELFEKDYAPYMSILKSISGHVLDIGGGIGVPRAYISPGSDYVSLEPSLDWLAHQWKPVCNNLSILQTVPDFVQGVGEHLPFTDNSFDAALLFWSLNHVSDPAMTVAEIARVLKPGGRAL